VNSAPLVQKNLLLSEVRKLAERDAHVVWRVAFCPNGRWLASGSADRTAKVWEVATGRDERRCLGFRPDEKLVSLGWDDKFRLSDLRTYISPCNFPS
jgi:WD40 repeat protein